MVPRAGTRLCAGRDTQRDSRETMIPQGHGHPETQEEEPIVSPEEYWEPTHPESHMAEDKPDEGISLNEDILEDVCQPCGTDDDGELLMELRQKNEPIEVETDVDDSFRRMPLRDSKFSIPHRKRTNGKLYMQWYTGQ